MLTHNTARVVGGPKSKIVILTFRLSTSIRDNSLVYIYKTIWIFPHILYFDVILSSPQRNKCKLRQTNVAYFCRIAHYFFKFKCKHIELITLAKIFRSINRHIKKLDYASVICMCVSVCVICSYPMAHNPVVTRFN